MKVSLAFSDSELNANIPIGPDASVRIDLDRHFGRPNVEKFYKSLSPDDNLSMTYILDNNCQAQTTLKASDIGKAVASRVPPHLLLDPTVVFEGDLVGGILKGDQVGALRLRMVNDGQGPAWGVRLKIRGKYAGVSMPETLDIGDFPPGTDKSVSIPISAGIEVYPGSMELSFQAVEQFGNDSRVLRMTSGIILHAMERPDVQIGEVRISDNGGFAKGNGNRTVENGETVEVAVSVRNEGVGLAKGVLVGFESLPEGLRASISEAEVGDILPGGAKEARLAVEIPMKFQPGGSKVLFALVARDSRPINVKARKPIEVSYRYNSPELRIADFLILDGDPGSDSRGNRNHLLEQDEQVEFRVRVKNDGTIAATGVRVDLRAEGRPELTPNPSYFDVGTINPGDIREAVFKKVNVLVSIPPGIVQFTAAVTQKDFNPVLARYAKPVYEATAMAASVATTKTRLSTLSTQVRGGTGGESLSIEEVPFFFDFRRPSNFAVIIGIDRYKEKGIIPLPYAGADARSVRDYLVNIGGFPKENVRLLTGEEATLAAIRINLKWLRQNATKDGIALVYFSGHGIADLSQKGEPYLLPYDGYRSAVEETAWPLTDLKKMMTIVDPAKVVALIDACYTGEGRSFSAPDARPGIVRVRDSGGVGGAGLLLAASQADQPSWDYPESGHGLFTWALLKGLRGGAVSEDGFVYPDRLFDYLKREVPPLSKRLKGVEQTPVMSGVPWKVPLTKAVR